MRSLLATICALGLVACASGVVDDSEEDGSGGKGNSTTASSGTGGSGATGTGTGASGGGVAAVCGDGVKQSDEACDQLDFGANGCTSLGFLGGELVCTPDCMVDATGCYDQLCGNGTIEAGEDCDGPELGMADCVSLGFAGGTLACDDMCHFTGCFDDYTEDFEAGPPFSAGWSTSGNAQWLVSTASPHMGSYAAESGNISDSQSSSLTRSLTFTTAGTIAFWHRESTESNYDYLDFYVDGSLQGSWSGDNAWAQATFNVGAGAHTFEWRYDKDSSLSSNSDTVWIDDVLATNGYAP